MRISDWSSDVCSSDLHSGSTAQTWDQLALMVKASDEGAGLEFPVIKRLLMMTIDILVPIKAHGGRRYITGIDFDPQRRVSERRRRISPCARTRSRRFPAARPTDTGPRKDRKSVVEGRRRS